MPQNPQSKFTGNSEGILLVDKPKAITSFNLVAQLRRRLKVKKIGHAGTLDPFATGVMVMLIGRAYTKLSDSFLASDKEYIATVKLGETTDSYDCDGQTTSTNDLAPSLEQIQAAIAAFQGTIEQVPPMFSAKKIGGKKCYELARQGKTVERAACTVTVSIQLLSYTYPYMQINVVCSKGTYIRSLAHDLGAWLGCGAHLTELRRTRSGNFKIEQCIDGTQLLNPDYDIESKLVQLSN